MNELKNSFDIYYFTYPKKSEIWHNSLIIFNYPTLHLRLIASLRLLTITHFIFHFLLKKI